MHLRGGLLTLARATLEQMAGDGTLDRDAMADLAEVRWRGGDLSGAADAARAHQASGGNEPLAALIIAEDLARSGATDEASGRALDVAERVGGAIDVLFALEPRSDIWPDADDGAMPVGSEAPGRWGLLVGGHEVADPDAETWKPAPPPTSADPISDVMTSDAVPRGRGGVGRPSGPPSTDAEVMTGRLAGDELEQVDRALESGELTVAVHRLAVLLRLDPALAPVILSAADRALADAPPDSRELAAIHLVRGDAYRTLGRDTEAADAYQQAHRALDPGPTAKESM